MKLKSEKKQSRYSYEVSRFLNYLSIRNSQYNSEEFDTPNIIRMALADYHFYFWGRVSAFLITMVIAFIGLFFFNNYNHNIAQLFFYLVMTLNTAGFFLLPRFKPDGVCYSKIINKVRGFDKAILNSNKIDFKLIKKLLLSESGEENKSYLELYYLNNSKEWTKADKSDQDTRLLSLYYLLNKTMSLKTNDDELGFLLGSLICGSEDRISKERLSKINRYNKISEELSEKDLSQMEIHLAKSKQNFKKSINYIDQDIQIIRSIKNNFKNSK